MMQTRLLGLWCVLLIAWQLVSAWVDLGATPGFPGSHWLPGSPKGSYGTTGIIFFLFNLIPLVLIGWLTPNPNKDFRFPPMWVMALLVLNFIRAGLVAGGHWGQLSSYLHLLSAQSLCLALPLYLNSLTPQTPPNQRKKRRRKPQR